VTTIKEIHARAAIFRTHPRPSANEADPRSGRKSSIHPEGIDPNAKHDEGKRQWPTPSPPEQQIDKLSRIHAE
jgi:hypothetical protein